MAIKLNARELGISPQCFPAPFYSSNYWTNQKFSFSWNIVNSQLIGRGYLSEVARISEWQDILDIISLFSMHPSPGIPTTP